jgi:hypothetical protein
MAIEKVVAEHQALGINVNFYINRKFNTLEAKTNLRNFCRNNLTHKHSGDLMTGNSETICT